MRTKCALAAHLRALAVCKALFTSPRGVHPRGAFLCNRNGVSYYTKKTAYTCVYSPHPLMILQYKILIRSDRLCLVRIRSHKKLMMGMWSMNEAELVAYMVKSRTAASDGGYLRVMLMIAPFAAFLQEFSEVEEKYISNIICICSFANVVVCTVLQHSQMNRCR